MLKESKRLADELGSLKNSILTGAGNRSGILGEMALAKYLGATKVQNFGFDLIYKDFKVEVKTKRRTCRPKDFYEGSVAETSSHQKPDFYAFLSLSFDEKKTIKGREIYSGLNGVWFCGVISYKAFLQKSHICKSGDTDVSNGFVTRTNMRNIKYSDLNFEWK